MPFQCSISVFGTGPEEAVVPTAHTLEADSALTASRAVPVVPPGFGLATTVQAAPFQRRISVFNSPLLVK